MAWRDNMGGDRTDRGLPAAAVYVGEGAAGIRTSSPTPLPTAMPTAVPTAALGIAYIDHDSGGAWLMAADGRAGAGHASANGSQTGTSTAWEAWAPELEGTRSVSCRSVLARALDCQFGARRRTV